MRYLKRKRNKKNKFYPGYGSPNDLTTAEMPEPLLELIRANFTSKQERDIAFLVCKTMYGSIREEFNLPISRFLKMGYSRSSYSNVIEHLIFLNLIIRTKKYSGYLKRLASYKANLSYLIELMRHSERNLKGIHGKKIKRYIEVKSPELKAALRQIYLPWSQENAIEYCRSFSLEGDQARCFETMMKMTVSPTIKPSWREGKNGLAASNPPLNILQGLWKQNIVGGGKPLYSLDFKAFYPNLTSFKFTGKPCAHKPYERFMELMKKNGIELTREKAKKMLQKFLNKGKEKHMTKENLDRIKTAILESLGLENLDFKTVSKARSEIELLGGEIMKLAIIRSVSQGYTQILPYVDCLYTTHDPETIKAFMVAACKELIGYELPIEIIKKPTFVPTKAQEASVNVKDEDVA